MKNVYVLIRKCAKEVMVFGDLTAVASEMGITRDGARLRLPYYENADYIFSSCTYTKSKRGKK